MDGEYSRHDQLETILQDSNSEPQALSLAYLKKITNEFANDLLLGEGGFGKVYKGVLQNGRIVAVKKLFQLKPGLQTKQFENEVYHLIRLKHPNIVRFAGYCYETRNECVEFDGQLLFAEKQQRLLCLEYLSNGSLDRHLSDESCGLDWGTRYKIIKGICCGIHYLHEGCKHQINGSIIHLDLKPANILLDDNMVPKVADFGLSRLFHGTKTQTCTTNLAGTFGYMAPEYIYGHVITNKADIYSLGVLIIEIITGDRSDPFSFNSTSSEDFVEAVLQKWRNRLKDAPLETYCNQIKLCLEIGLKCFKVDRDERPTAKEIIDSLDGWERRNSVDKLKLEENTNSVDNNGDALQLMPAAAALAVPAPASGAPAPAPALGINYGRVADNLPPPQAALLLLRALNATRVKLYDADARVLRAFAGSGVDFTVGVPDRLVPRLATDPSAAAAWVRANLLPHLPATSITAVTVGNEVLSGTDAAMLRSLLPAMESLHAALAACDLTSGVSVTTAHSLAVLSPSFPPSSAAFRHEVLPYMSPLLGFLARTGAPFLVNAYPYFAYKADPARVDLGYALFEANSVGGGVADHATGLRYDNMLHAQVDAVRTAICKYGKALEIRVSETGWPSQGDDDEAGATPENAARYNGNLMRLVAQGKGTPAAPGEPLQVYVFALFNENQKHGPASERHYGLFKPDGTPAYDVGVKAPTTLNS